MTTKFTPGPWENIWDADGDHAIHSDDGTLVAVSSGDDCVPHGVDAANASLIAAAPEMYEALKELLRCMEAMGCTGPAFDDARAALAKADGTQ